jgi:hypothetical protein
MSFGKDYFSKSVRVLEGNVRGAKLSGAGFVVILEENK